MREGHRIEGNNPPAKLGKLLDAEGALSCLAEETIRFTPPNQLNDKLDCVPFRYKTEDIEKAWRHFLLTLPFPEQKQKFYEQYANRSWDCLREQLSKTIGNASFTDLSHCDLT